MVSRQGVCNQVLVETALQSTIPLVADNAAGGGGAASGSGSCGGSDGHGNSAAAAATAGETYCDSDRGSDGNGSFNFPLLCYPLPFSAYHWSERPTTRMDWCVKKQDSGAGYGHITIPCWHLSILSTWESAHGAFIRTALPVQHICIHSSLSTTKIRPNIGC